MSLRQPFARKPGHRPKLIQFVEKRGARTGLERIAHAFHAGLHLFPIQRRLHRRHAGRFAARAPRKIRPERTQLESAGQATDETATPSRQRQSHERHSRLPEGSPPHLPATLECFPPFCLYGQDCHPIRGSLSRSITGFEYTGFQPIIRFVKIYRCSTSQIRHWIGGGINCTPLGLHRVAEKIGGGWPVGAVFRSRQMVGFPGRDCHLLPSRIASCGWKDWSRV